MNARNYDPDRNRLRLAMVGFLLLMLAAVGFGYLIGDASALEQSSQLAEPTAAAEVLGEFVPLPTTEPPPTYCRVQYALPPKGRGTFDCKGPVGGLQYPPLAQVETENDAVAASIVRARPKPTPFVRVLLQNLSDAEQGGTATVYVY